MNQLMIREAPSPMPLGDRRKNSRCSEMNLLVITGRGTGKLIDVSKDGLSFGCLYPHTFPLILSIDILDAKGLHVKKLKVRKVWERNNGNPEISSNFELEVGVAFLDLTSNQEDGLDILLGNLLFADIRTP